MVTHTKAAQPHSSDTSGQGTYPKLSTNASMFSGPRLSSRSSATGPSLLTTNEDCFNIRTFPSASSSTSKCCGPCTLAYPDVQILHWPVTRTNTWCDSIKAGLSKNPFSTIAPGGAGPPPPGAIVDYRNVSTAGFDKTLLAQGPAFLFDSIDNYGNIHSQTTTSIGRTESHVTRPPNNGSYSIDDSGFV